MGTSCAREKTVKTIAKSALVILVFWGVSVTARGASITDALPPDTYAVVYSGDLPAARAAGADTAYGAILAEPAVQKFLESGFPSLSELKEDFRGVTGAGLREMLDFCKGVAAVAVLPDQDYPAAVVVILDVGAEHKEFSDYIARNEARTGLAWSSSEVPGATVKTAFIGRFYISHATAGRYFVLSNSNSAIGVVVSGLLSGRKDSLSQEKGYLKCTSLTKLDKPQFVAYANASLIVERLLSSLPEELEPFINVLGIKSIGAISFASRSQGKGFIDEFVYYYPTGREGIFSAVKASPGEPSQYLSMIPAASMSAAWATVDMKRFSEFANALYDAFPAEPREKADEFLAGFKEETGVDIRNDLLAGFGDNYISYAPLPSTLMGLGFSGGFGQGVFLAELSDQARFEATLSALWSYAERKAAETRATESPASTRRAAGPGGIPIDPKFELATEKFGKFTIYKVRVILNPSMQLVPSFSVRDGWFVLSLDPQSVKNSLGAPLVFKPNLLSNRDYTSAAAACGPGNSGISYSNNRALFDSTYPLLSIGLPFILAYTGGSMPADQIMLPPADAISPHLFGTAGTTFVSPDSIRVTEYGPIGLVRAAYLAGTGAAALGKWISASAASRSSGPVPMQRPFSDDLARLKSALDDYAAANGGKFPPDAAALADHSERWKTSVASLLERYRYVPGLRQSDDGRLIVAFDRNSGPAGRRVLFATGEMMNLSDEEVREQVGGWLLLADRPTSAAQEIACLENLKALGASVRRYAEAHEGMLPARLDVETSYRFAPLVTSCPADSKLEGPDYATTGQRDISKIAQGQQASFVLAYETGERHGGKNGVVFLDGTTKLLSAAELKTAIEKTKTMAQ